MNLCNSWVLLLEWDSLADLFFWFLSCLRRAVDLWLRGCSGLIVRSNSRGAFTFDYDGCIGWLGLLICHHSGSLTDFGVLERSWSRLTTDHRLQYYVAGRQLCMLLIRSLGQHASSWRDVSLFVLVHVLLAVWWVQSCPWLIISNIHLGSSQKCLKLLRGVTPSSSASNQQRPTNFTRRYQEEGRARARKRTRKAKKSKISNKQPATSNQQLNNITV